MYTLATIFIFSVIGLSIYFQLTKNKKFKIDAKNKKLVQIFTKTNPSLLYPILFLLIHFLILFFGIATNSGFIGILAGGIGSLAIDPVIMTFALVAPFFFNDFKKSVICIFSTAFIVCILSNMLIGRGGIFVFLCRFDAMLLWSSIGMLGRAVWGLRAKPN
tara:strand:+ start:314 stop:796 length:483 start_codon:yes stop_codon:yes gene_type:complete